MEWEIFRNEAQLITIVGCNQILGLEVYKANWCINTYLFEPNMSLSSSLSCVLKTGFLQFLETNFGKLRETDETIALFFSIPFTWPNVPPSHLSVKSLKMISVVDTVT